MRIFQLSPQTPTPAVQKASTLRFLYSEGGEAGRVQADSCFFLFFSFLNPEPGREPGCLVHQLVTLVTLLGQSRLLMPNETSPPGLAVTVKQIVTYEVPKKCRTPTVPFHKLALNPIVLCCRVNPVHGSGMP